MDVDTERLYNQFRLIGLVPGDTVLLRAAMSKIGPIVANADELVDALLGYLGPEGTIVSLAFTKSSFIEKPSVEDAFTRFSKSTAGALPNCMIKRDNASRSTHPTNSYIAIGKNAEYIVKDHGPQSKAFEPIRKIIELDGKCMLIGCVGTSPGFTTTHLAEADLGLSKRVMFSRLFRTYYYDIDNKLKMFVRTDSGMCSSSYYKFYSLYIKQEILSTGFVGNAYSIVAPAKETYRIESDVLRKNPRFNTCDSLDCLTCNVQRSDMLYRVPIFLIRKMIRLIRKKLQGKH